MKTSLYHRPVKKSKIVLLVCIILIYAVTAIGYFYMDGYDYYIGGNQPDKGLIYFYTYERPGLYLGFLLITLFLPANIFASDILNERTNRLSTLLKSRLGFRKYQIDTFIQNLLYCFITYLIIQICIALTIHFLLLPLDFSAITAPSMVHPELTLFSSNALLSFIIYICLSSVGFSIFSSLIYSLKNYINNIYIFRGSSLILGFVLFSLPALVGITLYQIFSSEIVLFIFNAFFLPNLIHVGIGGFGRLGPIISPLISFLSSACLYLCIALILWKKSCKKEYIYD